MAAGEEIYEKVAPMPAPTPAAATATPPPQSAPAATAATPPRRLLPRLLWPGGLVVLAGLALAFVWPWWSYRRTHSITDDAFVEAHIINVAPQTASGHIVRFLVEENDRVKEGDILVQLDRKPYQVQVEIKKAAVQVAEKNLVAAVAQARGMAAQTRSKFYKLTHAMEDVNNQIANLGADVATLDSRKATLQLSLANLKRGEQLRLRGNNSISQEELDQRRQAVQVDEANVEQALQKVYADRVALGLPVRPKKGHELAEVPPDLDQEFSTVRQALADTIQSATQLGYLPTSWDATPEQAKEEFYQQEKNRNLNAIYAKLIDDSPAVTQARANLQQARSDLDQALLNLSYTRLRAPFPGVVVKRYLNLGDFASPGVAVLSMYNPDQTYVTANLEETRLPGVSPGNPVELLLDAFAEPFRGRVVWIDRSTGAQFALMPRNVVSGEFTKVVQRVAVRIQIEQDERWPLLRAGLSVRAIITHGPGDPQWAEQAAREMRELETRYNQPQQPDSGADPGDQP
jgi:membrane fusion protein (multidrug efflux system)